MRKLVFLALIFTVPLTVSAECICTCINENRVAVCDSDLDIRPMCPDNMCPIDTGADFKPIGIIDIPPVGASSCDYERVYDEFYKEYRWEWLCQ